MNGKTGLCWLKRLGNPLGRHVWPAALVAFNPEHKKFTLAKSAFELSHIKDWLESVRMGGAAALPLHVRRAGASCVWRPCSRVCRAPGRSGA